MVTPVLNPKDTSELSKSSIAIIFDGIKNNKSLSIGVFFLSLIIFIAIFADVISPYHFAARSDNCPGVKNCRFAPPSSKHFFGTNLLGRDVFARVLYGSRIALQMSFAATVLALMIGVPLGVISGYFGGVVDRLLNSIADAIYSFPSLLLSITFAIALGKYGNLGIIMAVSFGTAAVFIPLYFKVTRSQILQIKQEAYVDSARSMGASNFTIIVRYIVPNILAAPLALIPFNMTEAILTNAGLAFLGISVQSPTADWGFDVYDNKALARVRTKPWLIFFPGFMIFLLSFAYSLIGDALNDKFNPLLRGNQNGK